MLMKNLFSHTLRTGFLMTAALTLLMTNMVVYAAEDDPQQPAGIFMENDVISGTVTEVGADTITVRTYGYMDEAGMPGGQGMPGGRMDGQMPPEMNGERPELPEGQTPPEMNGERPELPEGQTPPEMNGERPELPEGQMPPEMNGERPELPEGQTPPEMNGERPELPEGQTPPEMGQPQGEGRMMGGNGFGQREGGQAGAEMTVSIDADTTIVKGDEAASRSDITVGTNVMILLDGSKAQIISILD